MAEFEGFSKDTLPFFKALAFHQSKDWFDENRDLYESAVRQPLGDLIEDLSARFNKAKIPLAGDRKRSLFRINRDIRFSKDKSPYKTNGGGMLTRSGSKNDPGLLYIHIDPSGCFTAAGFYMPDSALLDAIRKKIVRDPAAYNRMVGTLRKGKLDLSEMSPLTRMPRGYEDLKDSPIAPALRMKSFITQQPLKDSELRSAKLVDTIADFTKRSLPLLRFGWEAAGVESKA